jgi:hypothetical protein
MSCEPRLFSLEMDKPLDREAVTDDRAQPCTQENAPRDSIQPGMTAKAAADTVFLRVMDVPLYAQAPGTTSASSSSAGHWGR